jgi:HSP20 family protein
MEEFFDRFGGPLGRRFSRQSEGGGEAMTLADWIPSVDIEENDDDYLIKAELPEVRKEDVKVSVDQGVLTIQGERKSEREEKNRKLHRVERSYGSFARSFTLPENVREDGIRARFKDGMLYLQIEKSEQAKRKAIDVKID